jgi:hypothetical protein
MVMSSNSLSQTTSSPSDNLVYQVQLEKQMIDSAPVVHYQIGQVKRCHLCGQPIKGEPVLIERVNGMERVRGVCCGPS